jgi:hypothetical protein
MEQMGKLGVDTHKLSFRCQELTKAVSATHSIRAHIHSHYAYTIDCYLQASGAQDGPITYLAND